MLRISREHYGEIREYGERTYPNECCGVLVGRFDDDNRLVEAVRPCANTRTDSLENRYNIDPRELVRIQREAHELSLEVIGFYHSHPDHPARWSPTDLAEAHWIGCSYVITSIEAGQAVTTNSFLLAGSSEEDKRFVGEPIEVGDASESNECRQSSETR